MTGNPPVAPEIGAVLSPQQWLAIQQAAQGLHPHQLLWISGYFAGLAGQAAPLLITESAVSVQQATLTILYGSQTGNAKGVATAIYKQAEQQGIAVQLVSMADYKPRQLKQETHVLVVVSTHGEGDAPDDAVLLHEFIGGKKAPRLDSLRFAVIGLGDSSYEFFCQTGKDFDTRLSALGATSIQARLDCDVDYEQDVANWTSSLLGLLDDELQPVAQVSVANQASVSSSAAQYDKKNPFPAALLESQKITGRDSIKDIRHIEISLADSGISYQPGDALGVYFTNSQMLVAELLQLTGLSGESPVEVNGEQLTLQQALVEKLELTQAYPTFVQKYAEQTGQPGLAERLTDKAALREYLLSRQIVDIVKAYPAKISAQQLVGCLRPLTPRLYSIASSQAEVEDEVHLTVGLVADEVDGVCREGGASAFLCKHLEPDQTVRVYVEPNNNFRLPENPDTPVIMIGPGTGIAPFRAFLQQRQADGATGQNWLFFGNPAFTQDFLYQTEIQAFVKDQLLTRVSLAFSRDQQEKIYVQHRIQQEAADVWQWLQQGAHVYICGDANRMAKDVEQALLDVVITHGQLSAEQARQYLIELKQSKRLQKDVY